MDFLQKSFISSATGTDFSLTVPSVDVGETISKRYSSRWLIDIYLPTNTSIYLPAYFPTYQNILLPTYIYSYLPTHPTTYRHIYLPTSTPSSNNQRQTGINLVKHFENPKKVPMTILGRCHFWICFTPFLTITHKVSIAFNLRSLAHWLSRGLPCCGDSWLWVWILVPFTRSMDIFHIIFCKHESAVWPLKTKGWWMMSHVSKIKVHSTPTIEWILLYNRSIISFTTPKKTVHLTVDIL